MNTVERAKEIRKELKKEFPEVKFSVRSSRGGGSSINIYWTDFPTVKAVEEITNKYESIRYDEYTGEVLCGGNIFVFTNNTWSEEMETAIKENLISKYGVEFYNEYIENSYDGYRYKNEMFNLMYEASKKVKEPAKAQEVATDKKELYSNEEIQILEIKNTTRIYFNGKPGEEIRSNLKLLGFRFFKNDGFYWGIYSNKTTLEAIKEALNIQEVEENKEVTINNEEIENILKLEEEYKNQVLKEELKEIEPIEIQDTKNAILLIAR